MNKTVKWILIVVLILAVLAFLIYIFTRPSETQPGPNPNPTPAPGPGAGIAGLLAGFFSSDWIKNLLGGNNMANPACQAANPGYDNNGFYTRACGGVPGGGGANCNPDDPGKDMAGFNSSQCGG